MGLFLILSGASTLYFLWDLYDFQKRVRLLRQRLDQKKEIDNNTKILSSIPFIVLLLIYQTALGIGFALSLVILYYFEKENKKTIYVKTVENELPHFLRLMAVTIGAGLSTNTALEEIVNRMNKGPLNTELLQVVQEIRLGISRKEALKNWSKRMQSEQVAFLVQSWIQSEELGTKPGEVLNFLADQLHDRKVRQVETEAMQAGVKITLPLAFLIFPAVIIVIFGPIIVGGI